MSTGRARRRLLSIAGGTSAYARAASALRLTPSGLTVAVVSVVCWFAARALGAKAMYLMVYGALAFLAMAWLAGRRGPVIEVERTGLPERLRAGQQAAVTLRLLARRRISTVLITESLHARLGSDVTLSIASMPAGAELEHRYSFVPGLRGVYSIGPLTATWGDPFGLTVHRAVLAEAGDLIVHPPTETAHDRVLTRMWEDPPVRPPVSKPWPVGFEFYGMREYVPGDDLRRVVWSALAKTGKLMVRESEQGITDRVVILLDTDPARHAPGDVSDTFETAVRVAASVGVKHLSDGFSVTLMTNEGVTASSLRGSRARLSLLDELARVDLGTQTLASAGAALLEEAAARPHVLIATPHVDDATATQLRLLLDRGISVVIAHVMWEETDPRSLARAAALRCTVVKVWSADPLEAAFSTVASVGGRR